MGSTGRELVSSQRHSLLSLPNLDPDDDDGDDDDGDDDDDDDDDDGDDWMLDHHLPSPAPPPLHLLSSSHRLHLLQKHCNIVKNCPHNFDSLRPYTLIKANDGHDSIFN